VNNSHRVMTTDCLATFKIVVVELSAISPAYNLLSAI
jgi:hypothetical protein